MDSALGKRLQNPTIMTKITEKQIWKWNPSIPNSKYYASWHVGYVSLMNYISQGRRSPTGEDTRAGSDADSGTQEAGNYKIKQDKRTLWHWHGRTGRQMQLIILHNDIFKTLQKLFTLAHIRQKRFIFVLLGICRLDAFLAKRGISHNAKHTSKHQQWLA